MKVVCVNRQYFMTGGPERYMFALESKLRTVDLIPFCVNFTKNRPSKYSSYFLSPPGGSDKVFFRDFQLSTMGKIKYALESIYNRGARRKLEMLIEDTRPDLALFLNVTFFSHSIIDACKSHRIPVIWRLSDFSLICPSYLLLRDGKVCEECIERGLWAAVYHRCGGYQRSLPGAAVKSLALFISRLRRLFDYVSFFVVPSGFTHGRMIKAGFDPNKVVILPTFVDIPRAEAIQLEGPTQILYVGRISPEKGLETLIQAIGRLERSDFILRLAGNGDSEYVNSVGASLKPRLKERVFFMGQQTPEEVAGLYKASHVVVVPSVWYENMPNVVLEAMAHGRPVVASNLGSLAEMVRDGETGLLFEAGNAESLAAKLEDLMNSRQKIAAMGGEARAYIQAKHSPEEHLSRLYELFQSCVQQAPH
jgi:glycosyltransferase involved in cell wall biosynthesis